MRKRRSEEKHPFTKSVSSLAVCGHNGQRRNLLPLPRSSTDDWYLSGVYDRSRSEILLKQCQGKCRLGAALKPLVFSSGHNGLPLSLSLWEYRRSPSELKGSFLFRVWRLNMRCRLIIRKTDFKKKDRS